MAFGDQRGFRRHRGTIELRLDAVEATVLDSMLEQIAQLVDPGGAGEARPGDPLAELLDTGGGERPEDPAVLRLFPDAYRDDDRAAQDFRRFTERGLREAKAQRVAVVKDVLRRVPDSRKPAPVALTGAEADAFLRSLNDLRLVLGVRLDIVDDEQDVTSGWDDDDDPRLPTYAAYQWLTWLQSTLLEALAEG